MINDSRLPAEKLLRLLLQTPEHAVLLLDPDGRISWANPGAQHIFGLPADDMIGTPISRVFTPEDIEGGMPQQESRGAISHGASEDDRWQIHSSGARFWASGVLVALHDDDGKLLGFGKVLRDRTDLKEQIETLRNQAKALAGANREKDNFLAKLSHELRNSLAPLSNAVRLLQVAASDNPNVAAPVSQIGRQLERINRLVDDLLDINRIAAGKTRLSVETVSLNTVLVTALEAACPTGHAPGRSLELLLPPAPILIEADAARLHQVFVNLIINAVKYTPDGGRIWISALTEGKEAVVRVRDTGIGIPRDMLPRIFDLFTQVEPSVSAQGLGVGLALVKEFVTLHGGSVQVRSEGAGKGSEFTVRLPLQKP
jgi:PAS domain S-box-containing protein